MFDHTDKYWNKSYNGVNTIIWNHKHNTAFSVPVLSPFLYNKEDMIMIKGGDQKLSTCTDIILSFALTAGGV